MMGNLGKASSEYLIQLLYPLGKQVNLKKAHVAYQKRVRLAEATFLCLVSVAGLANVLFFEFL